MLRTLPMERSHNMVKRSEVSLTPTFPVEMFAAFSTAKDFTSGIATGMSTVDFIQKTCL